MSAKAVVVKRDNGYVYVNYFRRINNDYDSLVGSRKYSSKDVERFINEEDVQGIGLFLKNSNVGDVFNF